MKGFENSEISCYRCRRNGRRNSRISYKSRNRYNSDCERQNLSALRENGITLSLDNNEYTNAVKAFDMNGFENAVKSGAALSPDVIFVCVKGYSITDTIPFIKSVSKPETVVIPILNIYGTGRHMQKSFPLLR